MRSTTHPASRDYDKRIVLAFAVYMVVAVASMLVLQHTQLPLPLRALVAVAPVVPVCFGLPVFVRMLGQMDELQRRIQLEGLGFGFGATALLTFAYGFLENAGLPRISYLWIFPLMCMLWGIGNLFAAARYR